jgi:hypothetical protein
VYGREGGVQSVTVGLGLAIRLRQIDRLLAGRADENSTNTKWMEHREMVHTRSAIG